MKRDDREPPPGLEDARGVVDEPFESDELLVRGDSQRLERERRWIDVARFRSLDAADDLREPRGRLDRRLAARLDDRPRDPPRHRLLAEIADDLRQLLGIECVDEIGRRT